MEDFAAKRNVVSRRQQQQQQPPPPSQKQQQQQQQSNHLHHIKRSDSNSHLHLPLHHSTTTAATVTAGTGSVTTSGLLQPPPRSGTASAFLTSKKNMNMFQQFNVRDRSDASAKKRRFHVNIPRRMMALLSLIFFIAPLLVFFYKEIHIHDENDHHYKPERFINVDTQDVLSHLNQSNNNHNHLTNHNDTKTTATTSTTTGGGDGIVSGAEDSATFSTMIGDESSGLRHHQNQDELLDSTKSSEEVGVDDKQSQKLIFPSGSNSMAAGGKTTSGIVSNNVTKNTESTPVSNGMMLVEPGKSDSIESDEGIERRLRDLMS